MEPLGPDHTGIAWRTLWWWLLLPGLGLPVSLVARRLGHAGFLGRLAGWLIIVPAFLVSAFLGPFSFLAFLLASGTAAAIELARLTPGPHVANRHAYLALIMGAALPWPAWAAWRGEIPPGVLVAAITLPLLAVLTVDRQRARGWRAPVLALTLGAGLAAWMLLERRPGGFRFVVFAFSVVVAGDILAFLGGRFFPRGRPFPGLSPNKTLTGYATGIAGAVAVGFIAWFAVPELSVGQLVGASLLSSLAGAGGDLAASAVKRQHGVKDFGRLLGPQGGVLDRLDSLLVAGCVFHLLLLWRGL